MESQAVDILSKELLNKPEFRVKRKASVWCSPSRSEYLRIVYANFAFDSFLPKFLIFLSSHTSAGSSTN